MAYLLDGVILGLFLLMVYLGVKRGFLKTLTGVLSFVLALLLTSLLAAPTASLAYNLFIEPAVLSSFGEEAQTGQVTPEQMTAALNEMPSFVRGQLIRQNLVSGEAVLNQVEGEPASAAEAVSQQVIAPATKTVLEPVCSLILFLLLHPVMSWALKALNLLTKIPGIKQVNKSLGVVAGVAQGITWVFFAVLLIDVFAAAGVIATLTPQVVDQSVLVSWLVSINPMGSTVAKLFVVA